MDCNGVVARSDTFHVTYIFPPDTVYKHQDTIICTPGAADIAAPPGFVSYLWDGYSPGATLHVAGTGTHWVICDDPCTTDTVIVDTFHIVFRQPADTVYTHTDTAVCHTDTITLHAHPGFTTYIWNDGTTLPADRVVAPGTYWVIALPGCTDTVARIDTFSLSYPRIADTVFVLHDTALCNHNLLLAAPAGYYQYLWDDLSTGATRIIIQPGTYTVSCLPFCSDTLLVVTYHVSQYPAGLPFGLGADTTGCTGFMLHAASQATTFAWQDGSASDSFFVAKTGVYFCAASLAGCSYADTIAVTIPVLTQSLRDTAVCAGHSFSIIATAQVPPGGSCIWSNGSTAYQLGIDAPGTYWVKVSQEQCAVSDTMTVTSLNCGLMIHDAISPNGDGINDKWVIEGIEYHPGNTVAIFDKWGNEVFGTSNYNNDWEGKRSSGEALPDGSYFYLLKLKDPANATGQESFTGTLLIKR
jgi:gliding motility-associated-like protein